MSKPTETDITERLLSPSTRRKAFEDMVNMFSNRLYWQIRRMVTYHDDADDVLQNTFIKAWNGMEHFRGESKLSTWLYKIAYNDETEPGRAKLTVLHEIGHILLGHGSNPTEEEEREADYFAKQTAAPRCLLRLRGHTSISDIHNIYGLSWDASERTAIALERMANKFGDAVLENDREYIDWVRGWLPS